LNDLLPLAETIAARLKARRETIAVAESSTGGLISAALLAVPGASAYFLGGAVAYPSGTTDQVRVYNQPEDRQCAGRNRRSGPRRPIPRLLVTASG
jgi:nicotinamide-nucleotide amidase